MLDTPTKDMEPAPGWRLPRFLRFGDDGDETARPKPTKPPKEPEERKHHFAVWYVFAAFPDPVRVAGLHTSRDHSVQSV